MFSFISSEISAIILLVGQPTKNISQFTFMMEFNQCYSLDGGEEYV